MNTLSDFLSEDLAEYDVEYRVHATMRMFQRGITQQETDAVFRDGRVIERYGDDFPLPSALLSYVHGGCRKFQ